MRKMKSPTYMREEPKKKVNVMLMAPIRLRLWCKNYLVGYIIEQGDFCVIERRCQLLHLNALRDIIHWAWSIGGMTLTVAKRSIWRKTTNSRTNLTWTGLSSCSDFYTERQKTNACAMTRPVWWERTPEPNLNRWRLGLGHRLCDVVEGKFLTIQWQYLR